MKKAFAITILFCLSSNFVFAEIPNDVQDLVVVKDALPTILHKAWNDFTKEIINIFKGIINFFRPAFNWVVNMLNKEVETRTPEVKQELEKEKQGLKVEIPKTINLVIQKIKDIIIWWKR